MTVTTAALMLQTVDPFVLFIQMASSAKTSVLLMGNKSVLQYNITDTFSKISFTYSSCFDFATVPALIPLKQPAYAPLAAI